MSMRDFVSRNEQIDPPDPEPECTWCDGRRTVEVAAVFDILGYRRELASCLPPGRRFAIVTCPRCRGEGVEPKLDLEYEDPRL